MEMSARRGVALQIFTNPWSHASFSGLQRAPAHCDMLRVRQKQLEPTVTALQRVTGSRASRTKPLPAVSSRRALTMQHEQTATRKQDQQHHQMNHTLVSLRSTLCHFLFSIVSLSYHTVNFTSSATTAPLPCAQHSTAPRHPIPTPPPLLPSPPRLPAAPPHASVLNAVPCPASSALRATTRLLFFLSSCAARLGYYTHTHIGSR